MFQLGLAVAFEYKNDQLLEGDRRGDSEPQRVLVLGKVERLNFVRKRT